MNLIKTFFIVLLISCGSSKNATKQLAGDKVEEKLAIPFENADAGKIVFLTFTAKAMDSATENYTIRLFDKKVVDGVMKQSAFEVAPVIEPHYLYCELVDANKQRIKMLKVVDPLSTAYEYLEENKSFDKKVIKKEQGEFTVRFALDKKMKFLYLYKVSISLNKLKPIYYAML